MMDEESLFKKIVALPADKRRQMAHRILESLESCEMCHEDRYALLVSKAEVATYHTLGKEKTQENTVIRKFIAYRLYKEGYSWSEIGRLMHRNHSSVIALARGMEEILEVPSSYARVCNQFSTFNALVDEFDNG